MTVDLRVQPDHPDSLDLRDHLERGVNVDREDHLEKQDFEDQLDLRDLEVSNTDIFTRIKTCKKNI